MLSIYINYYNQIDFINCFRNISSTLIEQLALQNKSWSTIKHSDQLKLILLQFKL